MYFNTNFEPMNKTIVRITLAGLLACAALVASAASADPPLKLLGRTPIPGYQGDFDHLAADVRGNRLFLAGEEQGSLLVFDLQTGALRRTIKSFEEPHAIHYASESARLFVSDSGKSLTKVLDSQTYATLGTVDLVPGADVMAYDPSTRHLWIVSGGKNAVPKMSQTFVNEVDTA